MKKTREILKAERELQKEMERQVNIVYSAATIAMYQHYGWRERKIIGVLRETQNAWNTCAADPDLSMLRLLENETGIEIRARDVTASYHDLDYLSGKVPAYEMDPIRYLYMRKRQKAWVNPQITAALLLALHRKYGWSGERDERLMHYKDDIEAEYGWNEYQLLKACKEITGINIFKETNEE